MSRPVRPMAGDASVAAGDFAKAITEYERALGHRLRALAPASPPARSVGRSSGRIRIGFLSSWFDHANYMGPVWSLLKHLDRRRFDVHGLSDTLPADMPGSTITGDDATHWTGLLDNAQLVALVGSCGIDVLVDLNGFSAPSRLPAFVEPPAPVTLGWFNHYATSGLPGIRFIVGDRQVVGPNEETHFSERVICLPVSCLTFDPPPVSPQVAPPPCLAAGRITFGSLASQYRINPAVLDTFPYSGGTTTTEALWQGVPVLTIEGDRWASRTSRSLLHHAGLGRFVARDAVGLEDLAVSLAHDPATPGRLERWRFHQRRRLARSSARDAAALARHMGRLYAALWSRDRT